MNPKSHFRHLLFLAAAGLLIAPLASHADTVISRFEFTGNSLDSSDADPVTTTSAISFGSGISGGKAGTFNDRLEIDCIATTPAGPETKTLDAQLGFATTNNQYSTFTVTIPAGYTVDLTELTFTYSTLDAFRFGMGVLTDKTGFNLADRLDGLYVDTGDTTNNRLIDLSGIPSLQKLTDTTLEFRFYTGDNSTSSTREHRFGNILLSGTIEPYIIIWPPDVSFDGDANNDGIANGLAFLLGAESSYDNALGMLPFPIEDNGALVLLFQARDAATRRTAELNLEYSNSLTPGSWTIVSVPDVEGIFTYRDVSFSITRSGTLLNVIATISAPAASNGKLFARLRASVE